MIGNINISSIVDTKDSETEMLQGLRDEIKASGFEALLNKEGLKEADYGRDELVDGQSVIILMYDKI